MDLGNARGKRGDGMSAIKRRIDRLESIISASRVLPAWLLVAGPVSVIDPTVKLLVTEKRVPDQT